MPEALEPPASIYLNKNMKYFLILGILALGMIGCSSDAPPATAEEKKAFLGSAPPPGAMEKAMAGGKSGAAAAASHIPPH